MAITIGLFIGLLLGLTGAGGSLFALPLLMILLDYTAHTAMGMSLGVVAFTTLFGILLHFKSGNIQWAPAFAFLVIGSIFAPVGNYLRSLIPESYLLAFFTLLVLLVASRLWINAERQPNNSKIVRSQTFQGQSHQAICPITNERFKIGIPCLLAMCGAAAITGIMSGLFGVGGGFIIVPALIMITGMAIHQAVATSLVIISAISISGFISFILSSDINSLRNHWVEDFIHISIAGLLAMFVAKLISKKITGALLQKIFATLLIVITGLLLFYST